MNRLLSRKEGPSVGDLVGKCIEKCRLLLDTAATVTSYKDLLKQLTKFAKSLIIPLEDLQDNTFDGATAEKACSDVQKVADALDRGLELVGRCSELGRLQAIMDANDIAASFANVAKDLQLALLPMDVAELGCDEITQKQLLITLDQLGKVQAPFPEEQQRRLIQLRKLAESMRVAEVELKNLHAAPPESAAFHLRELMQNILDGSEMQQILTDRTVLRAMRAEAEAARNYVEKYFCDTLLTVISDLLPDDHEPSGVELRCTVMIRQPEQVEEPDELEQFLSKLGGLVDALKTSLVPTKTVRPKSQEERDAGVAPRRSPQELAAMEEQRHKKKLSCLEELLAVTADMPEEELPFSQGDIVQELACFDVVEPLLKCMDVLESPEARLQSAELLERLVRVQSSLAGDVVTLGGVAVCVRTLSAPDGAAKVKPTAFALKSAGPSTCGTDTFTPRLRAIRLLHAICSVSEHARATLAAPPAGRPKPSSQVPDGPVRVSRRRSSKLAEMVRASQVSIDGGNSCGEEEEPTIRGALSTVIQALVKVEMKEPVQVPATEKDKCLRPITAQSRFKVKELTDDEFEHLQGSSPDAAVAVKVMAAAAGVLELLSDRSHARVLVAQGGLLAVCTAIKWDLAPEINTPCASALLKLAEDPAYLQAAVELGACEHLAELAASENPEEHEAAALALSTLLKGTSTTVKAAPLLGSKAAAATASRTAAADLALPGSPASDVIPAGNFRAGGGIPSSTLLPLLQMIAMHGVNDVGVDLESTLHALCTASSDKAARACMIEISDDMASDAQPMYPLGKLAELSCELADPTATIAHNIMMNLACVPSAKCSLARWYKPFIMPSSKDTKMQGAMERLAALLVADPTNYEQTKASTALCSSLVDALDIIVSTAISSKGGALDEAAILLLGEFCVHCSSDLLSMIVKRDVEASEDLPSVITRLVALTSTPTSSQSHRSAVSALRQLVHRLPSSRREVLQRMQSAVTGGETPETAANSTHALHACLSVSQSPFSTPIASDLQEMLGLDLGAISSFLSLAASSSDRLQDELSLLTMRLCTQNLACLQAVCSLKRKVVAADITGSPTDQEATGLYLVKQLLQNGSELSRACACGMLGELALLPEGVLAYSILDDKTKDHKTDQSVPDHSVSVALPAQSREINQYPLIRASLLNDRTVDTMLEVLYEATTLLAKIGGVQEGTMATAAPAANPRQSRRASMKALSTDGTQKQMKKLESTSEAILKLQAAQSAAVRALTNMSYGDPLDCQKEVCKALAKVLQTGSAPRKLAASQVVQHTLAHASGRSVLCGLQIIPSLVSLCATGLPDARRAAAESLTNLAACTSLQPASPAAKGVHATNEASSGPSQAAVAPQRASFNPKIEVQRAGAISPLLAMLKCQTDEGLMRAAANALYVIAEEDENRGIMQGSGVRQALQNVCALAKLRPPKISAATRQDCEDTIARMMA